MSDVPARRDARRQALRELLDELLALGVRLRILSGQLHRGGQTVIMVTHDPTAASYADRLLVLADGRIVHDGEAATAEDVLDLMKAVG